ncbi:hypothetical protein TNCV_4085991 [Trichonephila clavipes]|nr:hypothetical protein TNCV_4085991 [Trichonephila clavipes]
MPKRWLGRFFCERSGRPSGDEVLRSRIRTQILGFKFGIHQITLLERHHFVSKLCCRVPHELNEKSLKDIISIGSSNLARHKRELLLGHLATGGEKWPAVRKEAYVYKGETPPYASKADVHQKKVVGETASA